MSNAVTALGGEVRVGEITVAETGLHGMVTLRGDLASPAVAKAVKAALGVALPDARRIVMAGAKGAAWMSPDELLLFCPYADAPALVEALAAALAGQHALVADVSDARATFRVTGLAADTVLRRLSPADIDTMAKGELRRTRLAQVACAFWHEGDGVTVVTFRSVADYVFALLQRAARPGATL
jgi:sarcosine oxidase subunit gamma